MRIFALAAAASMSLAPTLAMAQTGCPANAVFRDSVCVCADGFTLAANGACVSAAAADTVVAVQTGGTAGTAGLPVLGTIPPGAAVVGGLVVLAGVAIGIAAASDDDSTGTTGTTGTLSTPD